jgi:hypothetical protein
MSGDDGRRPRGWRRHRIGRRRRRRRGLGLAPRVRRPEETSQLPGQLVRGDPALVEVEIGVHLQLLVQLHLAPGNGRGGEDDPGPLDEALGLVANREACPLRQIDGDEHELRPHIDDAVEAAVARCLEDVDLEARRAQRALDERRVLRVAVED